MLDDKAIRDNTMFSARRLRYFLERARRASTDEDREVRLRDGTCVPCHYVSGTPGGGRAFTSYRCAACGEADRWPTTSVPKVCKRCSDERGICRRCAGSVRTDSGE